MTPTSRFVRTPYTKCRHCGCDQKSACVYVDGEWYTPAEQNEAFRQRFLSASEIEVCSWASHFVCSNPRCVNAEVGGATGGSGRRKAQ